MSDHLTIEEALGLQEYACVGPNAHAKEEDQGADLPLLWKLEGVLAQRTSCWGSGWQGCWLWSSEVEAVL